MESKDGEGELLFLHRDLLGGSTTVEKVTSIFLVSEMILCVVFR